MAWKRSGVRIPLAPPNVLSRDIVFTVSRLRTFFVGSRGPLTVSRLMGVWWGLDLLTVGSRGGVEACQIQVRCGPGSHGSRVDLIRRWFRRGWYRSGSIR